MARRRKPEMLPLKKAAEYIGKSASWLYHRERFTGPPFYQIGTRYFYMVADLDRWLLDCRRG